MDKPVIIMNHGKQVAMVFRKNLKVNGVQFFTDALNPLQIGIHDQSQGIKLTPHIHLTKRTLHINVIQEILFVQSGKIKVNLVSDTGEKIRNVVLGSGDSILLMREGHGVEFLEKSRIFEIKQGPYPGTTNAKVYLR